MVEGRVGRQGRPGGEPKVDGGGHRVDRERERHAPVRPSSRSRCHMAGGSYQVPRSSARAHAAPRARVAEEKSAKAAMGGRVFGVPFAAVSMPSFVVAIADLERGPRDTASWPLPRGMADPRLKGTDATPAATASST